VAQSDLLLPHKGGGLEYRWSNHPGPLILQEKKKTIFMERGEQSIVFNGFIIGDIV
jgi:hypothetical protein